MLDLSALQEQANRACNDAARDQGIITLGDLRGALSVLPPDLPVVIDGHGQPTELSSYRGYYERLSFGWGDTYAETQVSRYAPSDYYDAASRCVEVATPVTCAGLIGALNLADGETFEGYKGGQYEMHGGTFLHVAQYGDTGECVIGVRVEAERVVIETAEEVW